jgi:hypothetical protein
MGKKEVTPVAGDVGAPFFKHNRGFCFMKIASARVAGSARKSGNPLSSPTSLIDHIHSTSIQQELEPSVSLNLPSKKWVAS